MSELRKSIRGGAMEDVIDEHARWVADGLRVGERREFHGEELRELGLEPSGKPDDGRRWRVSDVDETSITVEPMSEQKIEPALTDAEWSYPHHALDVSTKMAVFATVEIFEGALEIRTPSIPLEGWDGKTLSLRSPDDFRAFIALANAALHDDDPRKITREWVRLLRLASVHATSCASFDEENPSTAECDCVGPAKAKAMADALASYLPPETGT